MTSVTSLTRYRTGVRALRKLEVSCVGSLWRVFALGGRGGEWEEVEVSWERLAAELGRVRRGKAFRSWSLDLRMVECDGRGRDPRVGWELELLVGFGPGRMDGARAVLRAG